ncbi:MAG: S8 family serine peptidase, partial [bacterium]
PYPDTIAENTVINSMQFCLEPPLSPDNHAHLLTMSLGWIIRSWSPRQAVWRAAVTNVAAAGLPYFIAAGNEGASSPPLNLRCPGHAPSPWHHPAAQSGGRSGSISIGATDASDNIASFSSWGPVTWDTIDPYLDYAYPPGLLKPDFSAPGVNVTSTRLGGGYTQMSGTSMATPGAAGVAALMLEKNPLLLPEEVDSIMQLSAEPLGAQPKNNTFGTGRVDAMRAVEMTPFPFGLRYARSQVVDSVGGNGDGIINPGESINLRVWVTNQCDYTVSGARGLLRTDDPLITITDSLKSFGTLGVGDTGHTGPTGFGFEVDEACTNAYALKFSLFLSDTLDSVWVSGLTLLVGTPMFAGDSVYAYDGGNGKLDPGEEADIAVQLHNRGKGNAYEVSAILVSGDSRLVVLDSTGTYGLVPADSWMMNHSDRFRVRVDASVPREFVLPCTLRVSQDGYPVTNVPFGIEVGRLTAVDPQPDGPRTPALYYAYEDSDSLYSEAPVFDWYDITGVGTRLPITGDDQTVQFNLPTAFGPFYFYGRRFTQLSVCSNGFIAPGYTTRTTVTNAQLPASNISTMLALLWDDLYPPTSGGIWWYHDEPNHRLIIQYDSMPYWSNQSTYDWHQLVIYDTTLAAPDGNSVFTYQYLTANNYGSTTVGINDSTTATGIQVLYDGSYHRGALPIVPGRAIKFTTEEPMTGVADSPQPAGLERYGLVVAPNPFTRSATVHYQLAREAEVLLRVYDAAGRAVRTLVEGRQPAGARFAVWNGNDEAARRVAHGVYFVWLETPDSTVKVKTVLAQ